MESLVVNPEFWLDKRVLLTGHTGFKGGWLALWLQKMNARVFGFSLPAATTPNLFEVAKIADSMDSDYGDITDLASIRAAFRRAEPEIVIHMAAQPLVRRSYRQPLQTYQTNVMGTLHVLECIRENACVKAAVMITTDKCYDNREWVWPYREIDKLGGHDPYSGSKACMELLIDSYRSSYFADSSTAIASARAGNVIGGGDWSEDRLLPDILRATNNKIMIEVRNPQAIRPWQHVLDPLSGYLRLAECLYQHGQSYAEAWNFGPAMDDNKSVSWILNRIAERWPQLQWQASSQPQPHEAGQLRLDCSKARDRLGWQGRWPLSRAIDATLSWHEQALQNADMQAYTSRQIDEYWQMVGAA